MSQRKKKRARPKERKKEGEVRSRRMTSPRGQTVVVWQEKGGEPAPALSIPCCLDAHKVSRIVEDEPPQGT